MPAGLFTQSAAVLFSEAPALEALAASLASFAIVKRDPGTGGRDWMGSAPSLVVEYRAEVNGYLLIDVLDVPWPDGMGSPDGEPQLFGAWSMGWFGPFVYPGALERAIEQPTAVEDPGGVVGRHRSCVRIKLSYVLGAGDDAPVVPDDQSMLSELEFVTRVAAAVATVPGALCYFNPNGETLHTARSLDEELDYCRKAGLPALPVWSQVRLINPGLPEQWMLMDTIGMEQLAVADHEACVPPTYDLDEVAHFLRNATNYVLQQGPVIKDGDTMSGPGDVNWQARSFDESLVPRPREVLRWRPLDGSEPPAVFGLDG